MDFNWDDHNIRHIARHRITRAEVEQVVESDPLIIDEQDHDGEIYWLVLGETQAARILVVAYTERNQRIRPATAYPAPPRLRRLWRNQRRG